ncbi:hypothetical protein C7M84_003907 [Penaeus vannamei]|uniref:Uncharacterized protein n=1 Tax=Penaeus vannamei TaxID=6689 RepID=A0A3R7PUI2_PENVA|nr:hypothetical protein C7M84_003907 [Penaeus vannamei]
MGSSCSSSQSLKDNVSVKSEDYAMDQKPSSQHQRTATPPPVRPVSSSTSDKSYDTESCVSDKAGGGGGGGSRQAPRPALSTNVLDTTLLSLRSTPGICGERRPPRRALSHLASVSPHLPRPPHGPFVALGCGKESGLTDLGMDLSMSWPGVPGAAASPPSPAADAPSTA